MLKIVKILIACTLSITISGCVVYRTRLFEPINYIEEHAYYYTVDRFDNWDVQIRVSAYKTMGGINPENRHDYHVEIEVSSNVKPLKYEPIIKNIKILYGEDLQHELVLPGFKYETYNSDISGKLYISLISEKDVYIPYEVNYLTVVSEIEFVDEKDNIIKRKFTIPMKRKETSTIGPPLI